MPTETLYKKEGNMDKQYTATLEGNVVVFAWGRRGGTPQTDTKEFPTPEAAARAYRKKLDAKLADNYVRGESGEAMAAVVTTAPSDYRPMLLNSIGPEEVNRYLCDPDWVMQQKADGIRAIVRIDPDAGTVATASRKALPVAITEKARKALLATFGGGAVIDCEVVDGVPVIFDLLETAGMDLRETSHDMRRHALHAVGALSGGIFFMPTAETEEGKRAALIILRDEGAEGVVFKRRRSKYVAGKPASGGDWLKFKFKAGCSVVVAGPHKGGKRSVEMALADGTLVGHVTIPEKHGALPPKGTIIEVEYLYAFRGGALIQPVYKGVRNDVDADGPESLQYKGEAR